MLLPSLGPCASRARAISCVNNLRIGIAVQMYWATITAGSTPYACFRPGYTNGPWRGPRRFIPTETTKVIRDPGRPIWKAPNRWITTQHRPAIPGRRQRRLRRTPGFRAIQTRPPIVLSCRSLGQSAAGDRPSNDSDRNALDFGTGSKHVPALPHAAARPISCLRTATCGLQSFDTTQMTYWYRAIGELQTSVP